MPPEARVAARATAQLFFVALSTTNPAPQEFRRYRRLVAGLVLGFVTVGCTYLLVSVGVTIYRQRRGSLQGAPLGEVMSADELRGCWRELSDVTESLQKHLENFHYLLGGYDQAEAQRWEDEGLFWRNQWSAVGQRCRFRARLPRGEERKDFEALVAAWLELSEIERDYTKELLRFGRHQAPRLDRVRERMKQIEVRLAGGGSSPGEQKP